MCPFCQVEHRTDSLLGKVGESSDNPELPEVYPSKLLALLEDVKQHMFEEKCIIFSVWKRTLDLIESLFTKHEISYCRVDGSVSTTNKRKKILDDFHHISNLRVLLMTLGTGAVGLNNLSVASRIHLLEPQWNPSVERQAIGRVLRLGQDREVKVIRYIMKRSIEEMVEGRQQFKLQMASGGFNMPSWLGTSG